MGKKWKSRVCFVFIHLFFHCAWFPEKKKIFRNKEHLGKRFCQDDISKLILFLWEEKKSWIIIIFFWLTRVRVTRVWLTRTIFGKKKISHLFRDGKKKCKDFRNKRRGKKWFFSTLFHKWKKEIILKKCFSLSFTYEKKYLGRKTNSHIFIDGKKM